MLNIFPERLEAALKQRGWNQADLHRSLGFAQSTISRWKSGTEPRGDTLTLLAQQLGVSPQWLIGESDVMDYQENLPQLERREVVAEAGFVYKTRSLDEVLSTAGKEGGRKIFDGMLESAKGKPVEFLRQMETLQRVARQLISEDPELMAEEKWWRDFEAKHQAKPYSKP